jgi:hypothetical protein
MTDSLARAVLRVGDGRGFVVTHRGYVNPNERIIVTAAHCLPFHPQAHPARYDYPGVKVGSRLEMIRRRQRCDGNCHRRAYSNLDAWAALGRIRPQIGIIRHAIRRSGHRR